MEINVENLEWEPSPNKKLNYGVFSKRDCFNLCGHEMVLIGQSHDEEPEITFGTGCCLFCGLSFEWNTIENYSIVGNCGYSIPEVIKIK